LDELDIRSIIASAPTILAPGFSTGKKPIRSAKNAIDVHDAARLRIFDRSSVTPGGHFEIRSPYAGLYETIHHVRSDRPKHPGTPNAAHDIRRPHDFGIVEAR
jgi:hypothetical protein